MKTVGPAVLSTSIVVAAVMRAAWAEPAPGGAADAPAAPGTCFPACRRGYVCSPSGQCVSECNPPCGGGEVCSSSECIAREETRAAGSGGLRMAVAVGAFNRWTYDEETDAVSDPGVSMSWMVWIAGRVVVEPRLEVLFAEGDEDYGFGALVGYDFRRAVGHNAVGVLLGFESLLWPDVRPSDEPVGLYLGVTLEPSLQVGRFRFGARAQYGHNYSFDPNLTGLTIGVTGAFVF